MSSPDVVIIGAGAIGAASAYELARAGIRVLVLERSTGQAGCSHGNAGLVSPSHSETLANPGSIRHGIEWMTRRDSPFHVRPRLSIVPWMARFGAASLPARSAAASKTLRSFTSASLERHDALVRAGVPTSFVRRGILSVFESEVTFELALERARSANGSTIEALEPATARQLLPALGPQVGGAIYHASEGHCDPTRFVHALLEAAGALGAEVRRGVEVLRLRRHRNGVAGIDTTSGPIDTGAVVLAAGVWARQLARDVGVRLPLEGGKGYHLEIPTSSANWSVPAFLEDAHVTATPLDGRLRLTGTLDLCGLDARVDPLRLKTIARAAQRTLQLPAMIEPSAVWRGFRPCAPDGIPIIGPVEEVNNLVLATGHAMLGIALAPITGEIVSELVRNGRSKHPIEPFAPTRFWHGRPLVHNHSRSDVV